jgi:hypothetical protein
MFQQWHSNTVTELDRCFVSQRAVRPPVVVPLPPYFRLHARFQDAVEQLPVQTLPSEGCIEAHKRKGGSAIAEPPAFHILRY